MMFLKYFHHVCKVQNRTADTVKFVDNDTLYFACADIIHHFLKARSVCVLARKTFISIFHTGFPVGVVSAIFKLAFYGYAVLFFD